MESVIKEKNESCNIFFFENGCCICMYYYSCINISSVNNYRAIKPLTWQRMRLRENELYNVSKEYLHSKYYCDVYLVNKKRGTSILLLNI